MCVLCVCACICAANHLVGVNHDWLRFEAWLCLSIVHSCTPITSHTISLRRWLMPYTLHGHTHTHAHPPSPPHTHTHQSTRKHTHTHTHTHARLLLCTGRTGAHIHTRTHTYTHTDAHTHTHAHTNTHARIHMHTHTHTHTHAQGSSPARGTRQLNSLLKHGLSVGALPAPTTAAGAAAAAGPQSAPLLGITHSTLQHLTHTVCTPRVGVGVGSFMDCFGVVVASVCTALSLLSLRSCS